MPEPAGRPSTVGLRDIHRRARPRAARRGTMQSRPSGCRGASRCV